MVRRIVSFTLLFFLISNVSFAARRRAVSPGGVGRCLFGPLADDADVLLLAVDATDVYYYDFFGVIFEPDGANGSAPPGIYRVPKNGGLPTLVTALETLDPRSFIKIGRAHV